MQGRTSIRKVGSTQIKGCKMELTERDLVKIRTALEMLTLRQTIKAMEDALKKLGYVNLNDERHADRI